MTSAGATATAGIMFAAAEFADERAYYSGALGKTVGTAEAKRKRDWSAGLAVYDISKPETPRQIGFMRDCRA